MLDFLILGGEMILTAENYVWVDYYLDPISYYIILVSKTL